jgi:hypothetical protein
MSLLDIKPVKSSKDGLKDKYPPLVQSGDIPALNRSLLVVGSSGSGKSVLINNLLSNENMWAGYFLPENMYIVSETGKTDDVVRDLDLPDENVFEDMMVGITFLEKLFKINKSIVKHIGADKAPQVLVYLDDFINSPALLKHGFFKQLWTMGRHANFTVIASVQHYKKVPPMARNQAWCVIIFQDNLAVFEMFADTFTPPGYSKKEFMSILIEATSEPYSFMYINKGLPHKDRYRKTFRYKIKLDRLEHKDLKESKSNDETV